MSHSPNNQFDRVTVLTERYLLDEISSDQLAELDGLVIGDPATADAMRTVMLQVGMMRVVFGEQQRFVSRIGEAKYEDYMTLLRTLEPSIDPGPVNILGQIGDAPTINWKWPMAGAAIAAMIAFAVTLGVMLLSDGPDGTRSFVFTPVPPVEADANDKIPEHVDQATLVSSRDADWAVSDLYDGVGIATGHEYNLRSGVAELVFASGAGVVIEGPSRFSVLNDNAMVVHAGRLVASVPPQARLFTIETPNALVVDYGTEFGVNVGAEGETEVMVFQGLVELREKPTTTGELRQARSLTAGQGSRILADGKLDHEVTPIRAQDQLKYARNVDEYVIAQTARAILELDPVLYWPMAGDRPLKSAVDSNGNSDLMTSGDHTSLSQIKGPEATGVFRTLDQALHLNGEACFLFAETIDKAHWQNDAYTIMLWMRVDETSAQNVVAMVPSLNQRNMHFGSQIRISNTGYLQSYNFFPQALNPNQEASLRHIVSSKQPIEEGKWVHVAVTVNQGHTCLYLDGELVSEEKVGLRFDNRYLTLVVGASTGTYHPSNVNHSVAMPPFRGGLAHLAMFNQALSRQQIHRLFNPI